jgi:dCTP deaminase
MILSGKVIREAIDSGVWKAWRGDKKLTSEDLKIGEHSVDVTLGNQFVCIGGRESGIDVYDPISLHCIEFMRERVTVVHGRMVLGYVQERFDCSEPLTIDGKQWYFTQMYDGRSTVARLGITSHQSSGYGDWGWSSSFTLEIANCNSCDVILRAGMRIGQISFVPVLGHDPQSDYRKRGAYNDQNNRVGLPVIGRERFECKRK